MVSKAEIGIETGTFVHISFNYYYCEAALIEYLRDYVLVSW